MDAIWRYVVCMIYRDIGATTYYVESALNVCGGFDLFEIKPLSADLISLLYDRLLDYINMYLNISIEINEGHPISESFQHRRHLVAIKGNRLCVPLHPNTAAEEFTFTAIPSDNRTPPWIRSSSDIFDRFLIFGDHSILYTVVHTFTAVYPTGKRFHARQGEEVKLAYALDARVIETRPDMECDKSCTTFETCVATRQLCKAIQYCDCIPFLFRSRYEIDGCPKVTSRPLPYCNQTFYSRCQAKLQASLLQHKQECRNQCEQSFYNWRQVAKETVDKNSREQTFKIRIYSVNEPFMEFRIAVKNTEQQFLSQVMGMVNFYLGFSGVGVCAFVVLLVDHIRRWCRYRRRRRVAEKFPVLGCEKNGNGPCLVNMNVRHEDAKCRSGDFYVTREELRDTVEKLRSEIDKKTYKVVEKLRCRLSI